MNNEIEMKEKTEDELNKERIESYKLREVLASANINFLFGSGVTGSAFPQLVGFNKTNEFLNKKYEGNSNSFEEKLNSLNEEDRKTAERLFVDEFNQAEKELDMNSNICYNSCDECIQCWQYAIR